MAPPDLNFIGQNVQDMQSQIFQLTSSDPLG